MRYSRIFTDADGVTHFADVEMPMTTTAYAPPAKPFDVSEVSDATGVVFYRADVGWHGEPHPTPVRQWTIILSGALRVAVSDGESRRFTSSDAVLLEDLDGAGHTTWVEGDEASTGVFVHAPAPR